MSTTRRVLVVGASGQVGAQLVQRLAGAIATTRATGDPERPRLDLLDLTSDPAGASRLLASIEPSAVICAGAWTDVDGCEGDPERARATNATAPAELAVAAANAGIPFVLYSTDYVFDGRAGPYRDDAEPDPLCVYGRAKLEGERRVMAAHPGAMVIRTTGVFGPDPRRRNFAFGLAQRLAAGGVVQVPFDQTATPTFNADLARITLALLQRGTTGIVHVAGPDVVSRLDFARMVANSLGLDASRIVGVATSELNQRAKRPLTGGLLNSEVVTRSFTPSGPAHAFQQWIASGENLPGKQP